MAERAGFFASLTIRTTMLIISLVVLSASIVAGVVTVKQIKVLNDGANRLYDEILPGLQAAEEMNVALGDMRIGGAEHILAHTPEEQALAEKDIDAAGATFHEWSEKYKKNLHETNAKEKALFDEIIKIHEIILDRTHRYTHLNKQYVELSRAQMDQEAGLIFRGEMGQLYNKIGDDLDQLIQMENEAADLVNAENDEAYAATRLEVLILTAVAIGAGIVLVLYTQLVLIRQIRAIVASMRTLAAGDKETEIPFTDRDNELGSMANSVQVFKDNMIEADRLRDEQEKAKRENEQKQREMMLKLADDFEGSVGNIVTTIASAATQLAHSAQEMSGMISDTSRKSEEIAHASTSALSNVQSVAAAAEELSASVKEISQQMTKSTGVVKETVDRNATASSSAQSLAEASQQISEIAGLIENIAGQINLLALNATIESARAGEAGKGFAVVASEVKTLATQTANATSQIGGRIQSVQEVTQGVLESINLISESVQLVNEYSNIVAAAVEEQTAVTNEIARNMTSASSGVAQISNNIGVISKSAQHSSSSADQVLHAAQELSKQAENMSKEISLFLQSVRAG